jgi:hypothetical protein
MRECRWLKRAWVLAVIAIFTFPFFSLTGSYAAYPATARSAFAQGILLDYALGEIVFCMKEPTSALELCNEYKIELDREREYPVSRQSRKAIASLLHFAKASEDKVEELIESLNHDSRVEYAERRYFYRLGPSIKKSYTPNVTISPLGIREDGQWPLKAMEVEGVPQSETLIAVVDTGMIATNPEMTQAIVAGGYDWFHQTSQVGDPDGHGTHVGNAIAGPYGVGRFKLLPEAIWVGTDSKGVAQLGVAEAALAVRHAVDNNAKVINLSFGGPGETPQSLLESIKYAGNHGVLCIAAAGNNASNNDEHPINPASCGEWNVIAVAGTANPPEEKLYGFSNYGSNVIVAAPGAVLSEESDELTLTTRFGTSFAAPFVSAEVALALDRTGGDAKAAKEAIASTVDLKEHLRGLVGSGGRVNYRRMRAGERNPEPQLSIASQFHGVKKVPISISVTVVNPSGGSLQFHWEFGDGKTEDTKTPEVSHKYKKKKDYQLVCTATYFTGRTFTVSAPVSIAKK